MATYWFEDSMREISITMGTNFNTIGIAFGFFLPTLFVSNQITDFDTTKNQIANSLLTQGIIAVALMLLAIFSFQNKPKLPPSSNAVVERDDNLLKSYGKLLCNFEFLKLSL
jgi:hypothetical protein